MPRSAEALSRQPERTPGRGGCGETRMLHRRTRTAAQPRRPQGKPSLRRRVRAVRVGAVPVGAVRVGAVRVGAVTAGGGARTVTGSPQWGAAAR